MSLAAIILALIVLAIWIGIVFGRGWFWWPRVAKLSPEPESWPSVTAIVPARDEAACVGEAIASLLQQDYPGEFSIVLVDDHSSDGTADIAGRAAVSVGRGDRLRIVAAAPLPHGWTGKLWALRQGVTAAGASDLLLFTDADIAHHPSNLRELAARLLHKERDLVSLMVLLHCESLAERFLIPAFVFFFALLYPFAWINDREHRIAAAAGGCILIKREALERIGGLDSIRGEMIDDCALAAAVKHSGGGIWLGLTRETRSLRRYPRLADIWNMVARTAYTQLRHSPWLLAGTFVGMTLAYAAPPLLLLAGGIAAWLGGAAWLLMIVAYMPTVRFYRLSLLWSPLLPAIALVYVAATIDSARRYGEGKGGQWKGRVAWRNAR